MVAAAGVAARPTKAADHNDPVGVQATYQSGADSANYAVATGDPKADIADLFAWYSNDKKRAIFAMTWRADAIEASERSFDPSVKYTIHVDDSGVTSPLDVDVSGDGITVNSTLVAKEHTEITFWFGERGGKWGTLVSGVPGAPSDWVCATRGCPVGKVHSFGETKVAVGLFDDAFFADLDGFFNSISVALPPLRPEKWGNPSLPDDRFAPRDPKSQKLAMPFGYPEKAVDGFGKQNVHAAVVEVPITSFKSRLLRVWGTTDRAEGERLSGNALNCSYDSAAGTYACAKGGSR